MGQKSSLITEADSFEGPGAINLTTISEKTVGIIAKALGFDLTKVQPEEFRTGIVQELDQMMVYTTAGINNEKLVRAATSAWENLQTHPSFYSNPPAQEFGHVLAGHEFSGDTFQRENIQKLVTLLVNESFSDVIAKLKASPANLWNAAKAKLVKSSGLFKGLINKSVSKVEAGAAKLKPLVAMIKQAEQESGAKLPVDQTMQVALGLPAKAKEAEAEIAQQQAAVAQLPQAQPAQQEAAARVLDTILVESMMAAKNKPRNKKTPLNEALTPMVVVGFVLALIGGIPMLINGLHKLATKFQLPKTAEMLKHMHHVAHAFEQKSIDYLIPDVLSYMLYKKFWNAGLKVRGSKALEKPLSREEYSSGVDHVRATVESIVYKIMLVWFFAQGIKGAWHAGVSLLGLAEGTASSVKAVEIVTAVTQVVDILGPDLIDSTAD